MLLNISPGSKVTSSLSSSYKTCVHDPQELILCGGWVKKSNFLIDEESVGNPDEFDILRTDNCPDTSILSGKIQQTKQMIFQQIDILCL